MDKIKKNYGKKAPGYTIIFDEAQTWQTKVSSESQLTKQLKEFFMKKRAKKHSYFDAKIIDEDGVDITDEQLVQEIIQDITTR